MQFVIIGKDGPEGKTRRLLHRPAHLLRLKDLERKGRLIIAGPFTDQTGSVIILEAPSLAEAETFAKEDPYTVHGVFQEIEVHPFIQVLPEKSR